MISFSTFDIVLSPRWSDDELVWEYKWIDGIVSCSINWLRLNIYGSTRREREKYLWISEN